LAELAEFVWKLGFGSFDVQTRYSKSDLGSAPEPSGGPLLTKAFYSLQLSEGGIMTPCVSRSVNSQQEDDSSGEKG
jgi:hypothetical protein